MPAVTYSATAGIIAHSTVAMDSTLLSTLKEEVYLLVHSCPVREEHEYTERTDVNGVLVYAAWYNFKVRWSVTATALAFNGLADYHPGAALSVWNLEFLNASRFPFQIPNSAYAGRKLVLDNPTQDPVAGGLVEVTFDVLSIFGDSTGPRPGGLPVPTLESSLTP